ncbi:hypothetical protein SAMN05421810_102414 [Amycolatopsis arida]|uniref:Uncharacterized protein n=1 Tax=Amycolatopsis arida TaxID=587909 RepID=A0A1I5PW73_9PSEU|nr:hypothetical protein CLV69_101414 [Amycolatopsis arida]SFP38070.1 hypothetical protein SAMN05421810_102414 [Amycolatopsis arida]
MGYPGPGYGAPAHHGGPRRPNPATAILAALLGLVVAGLAGYLPVWVFVEFGLDRQGGGALAALGLYLGATVLLLFGSLLTFFRVVVGAVLLIVGAVLGVAAVLLEPVLLDTAYELYFELVLEWDRVDGLSRIGTLAFAPVVLLLAVLPPTFRYLRHRAPAPTAYGPPPAWR